jgi:membrane protease YdiL (CAAX protease family)
MNGERTSESPPAGRRDVWGYLLFSHGWTWLFWGVNVVVGLDAFGFPGVAFTALGGVGPMLGGVVMSRVTYGREGLRDLRRRLVDPKRIPLRWFAVALLLQPLFLVVAAAVALLLGVSVDPIDAAELLDLLSDPVALVAYAGFVLLLGPLPEEIGWRGYLLDRLQLRRPALASSLLVGVVWASWHAPLFFMPGYYADLDYHPDPLAFGLTIVVGSVVYTWIFNNTARSVLAAILYHFAGNFTGQTVDLVGGTQFLDAGVRVAFVSVLLLWWGASHLRRDGPRPLPPFAGSPPG